MELHLTYDGAVAAAAGGAVLGAATMLKLAVNGNILGISGIVNGVCSNLVSKASSPWFWRVVFASGFIAGGAVLREVAPETAATAAACGTLAGVVALHWRFAGQRSVWELQADKALRLLGALSPSGSFSPAQLQAAVAALQAALTPSQVA